jgi:HAD superfamily hydrolase (TIGR01509 family)
VIFDVDGTLVNSNDAHANAWVDAFRAFGYNVDVADVLPYIGMGGDKLVPAVIGLSANSKDGEAISALRGERFLSEYLPRLHPFPGVRALCTRLRAAGVGLFVATSAKERELRGLIEVAGIGDLLSDTASHADAPRSKPDPDVVHAAVAQSGLTPDALILVGDTPYDVAAAMQANVRCVAVRSGGWRDVDLAGAAAIVDGTWSLLDDYPSFERMIS